MVDRPRFALTADDAKKSEMAEWAEGALTATDTTSLQLMQRCLWLTIGRLPHGPLGGDQQIGARIAKGHIDVLVFFIDPFPALLHDVFVKAPAHVAVLSNIRFALNRLTAGTILATLLPASPL